MRIINSDELDEYLEHAIDGGTIPLIVEARDWADHMELMLDKYQGPPLSLDWDQLSPEGITFLRKFWYYRHLYNEQIH